AEVAAGERALYEVHAARKLAVEVQQEPGPWQRRVDEGRGIARGLPLAILASGDRATPSEVGIGPIAPAVDALLLIHEVTGAAIHGRAGKGAGERSLRRLRPVHHRVARGRVVAYPHSHQEGGREHERHSCSPPGYQSRDQGHHVNPSAALRGSL